MAIPRNWDEGSPADNDFVSQYPANARSRRGAVKEIFGVDHVETEDSHQGKHTLVHLREASLGGASSAGEGHLAAQLNTTTGRLELRYKDDAGGLTWITEAAAAFGSASRRDVGVATADDIPDRADADARYLLEASNLSDLTNASSARTNLGLGTAATVDTGTGANNVPTTSQADGRYINDTGDSMSGALNLDNNIALNGRGTGGATRNLAKVGADNTTRFGDVNFPLRMASQDNPLVDLAGTSKRILIVDDLNDLETQITAGSMVHVNTAGTTWGMMQGLDGSNFVMLRHNQQTNPRSTYARPAYFDGSSDQATIDNHVFVNNTSGRTLNVTISMLLEVGTDDGGNVRLMENDTNVQQVTLDKSTAQQLVTFSSRSVTAGSLRRWGFDTILSSGSGTDFYKLLAVYAKVTF